VDFNRTEGKVVGRKKKSRILAQTAKQKGRKDHGVLQGIGKGLKKKWTSLGMRTSRKVRIKKRNQ